MTDKKIEVHKILLILQLSRTNSEISANVLFILVSTCFTIVLSTALYYQSLMLTTSSLLQFAILYHLADQFNPVVKHGKDRRFNLLIYFFVAFALILMCGYTLNEAAERLSDPYQLKSDPLVPYLSGLSLINVTLISLHIQGNKVIKHLLIGIAGILFLAARFQLFQIGIILGIVTGLPVLIWSSYKMIDTYWTLEEMAERRI